MQSISIVCQPCLQIKSIWLKSTVWIKHNQCYWGTKVFLLQLLISLSFGPSPSKSPLDLCLGQTWKFSTNNHNDCQRFLTRTNKLNISLHFRERHPFFSITFLVTICIPTSLRLRFFFASSELILWMGTYLPHITSCKWPRLEHFNILGNNAPFRFS